MESVVMIKKTKLRIPPPPATIEEANERIAVLRALRISPAVEPENFDLPVDSDIRIDGRHPEYKIVLSADNRDASWTTVIDFRQQIGAGVIRMGAIAAVGTREDCRFRGYSRRIMINAHRWMRGNGFDTVLLYGIKGFYPKFGYAKAFPDIWCSIALRDAEAVQSAGYRIVDFEPRHKKALVRMYEANNAGRIGPSRRDPGTWEPRQGLHYKTKAVLKVAVDADNRPAGYIALHSACPPAAIIETGFVSRSVFPDLLLEAARLALASRLEYINLTLPEDDAFLEFCKPLGLRKEITYPPDGGAMVRMINVRGTMGKLAGELESRMPDIQCLNIFTNLDSAGLYLLNGRLAVGEPRKRGLSVRLPQWALAQMLYGYCSARSLATSAALKTSPEGIDVLERLFPVRPHYYYAMDRF